MATVVVAAAAAAVVDGLPPSLWIRWIPIRSSVARPPRPALNHAAKTPRWWLCRWIQAKSWSSVGSALIQRCWLIPPQTISTTSSPELCVLAMTPMRCWKPLSKSWPRVVDAAAANLEPSMVQAYNMGACNNACWSAGEMAMAFPPETMAPHAPRLAAAFCRVLSQTMVHRSLGENASIALGRFALRCPEQIKQGFAELVTPWCGALRRLRDGVEKEHAFAGLVALARAAFLDFFPMGAEPTGR